MFLGALRNLATLIRNYSPKGRPSGERENRRTRGERERPSPTASRQDSNYVGATSQTGKRTSCLSPAHRAVRNGNKIIKWFYTAIGKERPSLGQLTYSRLKRYDQTKAQSAAVVRPRLCLLTG